MYVQTAIDMLLTVSSLVALVAGIWLKLNELIIGSVIFYFCYPILMEIPMNIYGSWSERKYRNQLYEKETVLAKYNLPFVYHESYNGTFFGLEKLNKLYDTARSGKTLKLLIERGILRNASDAYVPEYVSRYLLLMVTSSFLNSQSHTKFNLFLMNYSLYLCKLMLAPICFIPSPIIRWKLIDSMGYGTQGSVDASYMALQKGWAIHLFGGFHHACAYRLGGYSAFADISLCVHHLRKYYPDKVKKVMIIDVDAHQGNGHTRDFINDKDVCIIDVYNPQQYPGDQYAKKGITVDIPISCNETNEDYLNKINQAFPKAVKEFNPDFLIYNAGNDCLMGDPLGDLKVTPEGIIKRDELVFGLAFEKNIPILMLLSGGLHHSVPKILADSIENVVTKFNLIQKK